jgi:murein DD-endopeptidase MepM/ murein hydrolase activator NlpD
MLRKLFIYLFERISITIIPSPRHRVKVISFRRIVPILTFIIIVTTIVTLSMLYNYYEENYFMTASKLEELRNVRAENEQLKKELYALNQDTEELKENLSRLQEYNQEIKQMIELEDDTQASSEVDLELQTFFSYNQNIMQQGLPVGGGELQLFYQDPEEIIKRTRETISMLQEELPTQEETLSSLETSVKRYNDLQAATPKIWPLADNGNAYISSDFGWRTDPFSGKQEFHEGLDIGIWYNTPVMATADGIVKFAGWKNGYGYLVIINHGFGFETRYGHLNKIKVKKGEAVKRGQTIALSGNSGKSTGPHLHYEVRKNNIPQNPRNYIGR